MTPVGPNCSPRWAHFARRLPDAWIDRETVGCSFPDYHLGKRLHKVLESLSKGLGDSPPLACHDWAATKAAYRFLDNPRVDENMILASYFEATRTRFAALEGLTLVLHHTTELSYQRTDPGAVGKTHKSYIGRMKAGRPSTRTICGLLMHSSLGVTMEGPPLRLAAVKFWTRKKFKGISALKGKINIRPFPSSLRDTVSLPLLLLRATSPLSSM